MTCKTDRNNLAIYPRQRPEQVKYLVGVCTGHLSKPSKVPRASQSEVHVCACVRVHLRGMAVRGEEGAGQ